MFPLTPLRMFNSIRTGLSLFLALSIVGLGLLLPASAAANSPLAVGSNASLVASSAVCPFCSAINMTFWEQIKSHDAVVIAKLITVDRPVADIDAERTVEPVLRADHDPHEIARGCDFDHPVEQLVAHENRARRRADRADRLRHEAVVRDVVVRDERPVDRTERPDVLAEGIGDQQHRR